MNYKTIVVHCDAGSKLAQRLVVAVDLAQRHRAHLVGVHVQTPFVAPIFSDGVVRVDVLLDAYKTAAAAAHDQAEATFTTAIKGSELSTEWRRVEGYPEEELTVLSGISALETELVS